MMKLLRCHIENFGKIHCADFEFNAGLTQFCYENGYGKTTLAAFLKAMFYGLASVRKGGREFTDREHFYPFDGGRFGGNLVFEMGGKEYRVERYFDKKSDTADELTVYCANKPYEFPAEIGKAVFGLDRESFERTAFFTESDTELCATGGIAEKLNRFVERTEDGVGFEDAEKALDEAKKILKKGRGAGGRLDTAQGEISALDGEIENLERIDASLGGYYGRRSALLGEISAAEEKLTLAGEKNVAIEKWKHFSSLSSRQTEAAARAEQIRVRYAGGMPTREELAFIKSETERVNTLRELKKQYVFSDAKIEKLEYYDRLFQDGVPSEDVLSRIRADVNEANGLEASLAGGETNEDGRYARLEQKFGGRIPSAEEEEKIAERLEAYRRAARIPAAGGAKQTKKNPLYLILAIVFALVAVAGIVLLFTVSKIAGGVSAGVGVACLGVVAFLYLKKQSAGAQDAQNAKRLSEMQAAEGEARAYLAPFGYYSQNVESDFEIFRNEKREYLERKRSREEFLARTQEKRERYRALCERLQALFGKYRLQEESFSEALALLKRKIAEYADLRAEEKEFEEKQTASRREVERSISEVKKVYGRYALSDAPTLAGIEAMISDSDALLRLEREAETAAREAEKYRAENGLTQAPTEEEADVTPLREALQAKRSELAAIERQISDAEADAERLADKRARREVLKEEYARLQDRYAVISAALDALREADKNMKDRYVAPVRSTFVQYAETIEAALGERVSMDSDFRISFERAGQQRKDGHLSAGQKSVCALCFRLALIENTYGDEKPFLVLDDPFSGLDERHLVRTAATVRALTEKFQIVYFCCHESRKI